MGLIFKDIDQIRAMLFWCFYINLSKNETCVDFMLVRGIFIVKHRTPLQAAGHVRDVHQLFEF